MFNGKRRFENDSSQWVKIEGDSLDIQFNNMSDDDYWIYIIRHWLYCCASTPCIETVYSKKGIETYIKEHVAAGDIIEIWGIDLDADNFKPIISVKIPDENGLIPLKGAY